MKRLKYILILFILSILTGCVKYDGTMNINNDGSVELIMKYSMQKQNVNKEDNDKDSTKFTSNVEVNLEDYNFLKKYGYSIEEFTETLENNEEADGVIIYKKFHSLDEITSDKKLVLDFFQVFEEEDKNYTYDKFFYKEDNKYTANFIFDLTPEINGTNNSNNTNLGFDYSQYENLFNFKYTVTLPNSVKYIESNATDVSKDGKTLTWKLDLGKTNEVNFGFAYDPYIKKIDKIFIYSCLGAIGVSILFIVIISLTKINTKKKISFENDKIEEESNN